MTKIFYDGKELSKREKGIALCGLGIGLGLGIILLFVIDTLLKMSA